jgi:DNA-directed RNA polymerase sigma subunit (sigma70/sigma32)
MRGDAIEQKAAQASCVLSLNCLISTSSKNREPMDATTDGVLLAIAVEPEPPDWELIAELRRHVEQLTPREQTVVHMRWGFGPADREHTLEETGRALGVTKERVRQIQRGIMKRLELMRKYANVRA